MSGLMNEELKSGGVRSGWGLGDSRGGGWSMGRGLVGSNVGGRG